MLNEDSISNYMKTSRLVLLSKTNKTSAKLREMRAIAVLSQLMKILEKTV
jgi:hypothetical protein